MSKTFVMKAKRGKHVHGAYSRGELEIKGHFTMSGPQPIDDESGCPQWVADLLEQHPDIERVALSGKEWGAVFSRISEGA